MHGAKIDDDKMMSDIEREESTLARSFVHLTINQTERELIGNIIEIEHLLHQISSFNH